MSPPAPATTSWVVQECARAASSLALVCIVVGALAADELQIPRWWVSVPALGVITVATAVDWGLQKPLRVSRLLVMFSTTFVLGATIAAVTAKEGVRSFDSAIGWACFAVGLLIWREMWNRYLMPTVTRLKDADGAREFYAVGEGAASVADLAPTFGRQAVGPFETRSDAEKWIKRQRGGSWSIAGTEQEVFTPGRGRGARWTRCIRGTQR